MPCTTAGSWKSPPTRRRGLSAPIEHARIGVCNPGRRIGARSGAPPAPRSEQRNHQCHQASGRRWRQSDVPDARRPAGRPSPPGATTGLGVIHRGAERDQGAAVVPDDGEPVMAEDAPSARTTSRAIARLLDWGVVGKYPAAAWSGRIPRRSGPPPRTGGHGLSRGATACQVEWVRGWPCSNTTGEHRIRRT